MSSYKVPLLATGIGLSVALLANVVRNNYESWGNALFSRFVYDTAEETDLTPAQQRTAFNELSVATLDPVKSSFHSHPVAAAGRNTGSLFADRFGAMTGMVPYFIQCSAADKRNNREGSRCYYWTKDLSVEPSMFAPPTNSLNTFIDVDQYLDMPQYLAENFRPTLIYTFQPTAAARTSKTGNYAYTFNSDSSVHYSLLGGATFDHHVWNYGQDNIKVTDYFWGIPWRIAVYLVDRRPMDEDHEMILLTPLKRWTGLSALFAATLLGNSLLRLLPVYGNFARLRIHRESGMSVSTAQVGAYDAATISACADSAIASVARQTKVPLTNAQVMSYVEDDNRLLAPILVEYHRALLDRPISTVYPLEDSINRYQFNPKSYNPEAKPGMVPFMHPILPECYVPDMTKQNEVQCVRGRIEEAKMKCNMTPFVHKTMTEFIKKFIPYYNRAVPVDDDYVWNQQNRPSQRYIFEDSMFMKPLRKIKMFLKREAYADPKDPRPISTINGRDKVDYSKFIYPLAEHLKTMPWYAFGKTPALVADRVVEVCRNANSVCNSDFSRFDGHVTSVLRELEQRVLIAFFKPSYHSEIIELHKSQYNLKATSTLGVKYETGTARASGSPETAAFNSIANAYVAFLAVRMTAHQGAFYDADEAWNRLGVYGGDDGLTPNVDPEKYIKAGHLVGQVLVAEHVLRGKFGVKFLARMYGPHVWFGDNSSTCDLPRQLSKFHATVALPESIKPIVKLIEKARAFYLTDGYTPIIGDFCGAVINKVGMESNKTNYLSIWNSDVAPENQYPNPRRDWYHEYQLSILPEFNYDGFIEWLISVEDIEDFLEPPVCIVPRQPKITVPVVINGQVFKPKDNTKQDPKSLPKPPMKQTPRKVEKPKRAPARRGREIPKAPVAKK